MSPRHDRRRLGIRLRAVSESSAGASGISFLRWLGFTPFRLDRVGVVDFLLKLFPLVMLGDLPPPNLPDERMEVDERLDKVLVKKSSSSSSDEKPLVTEK